MNLSRVWGIILRHVFLTTHQLERFSDLFMFPLFGLVLWGFLANYVQFQSSSLASFFLGGLILWIIFERVGTSIGIDFMWDIWEKNIMNVLASPITLLEYIGGLVIVSVAKVFISFIAMILVVLAFYNIEVISGLGFSLVFFWINLVFFAVVMGIFDIVLVIRFGRAVGPLTWILPFMIQPFSAVFYPVSVFPEVLQKIVWLLPLSHVFEGMREVFATGNFNQGAFFIALVLNIVYFVLVVLLFSYTFNVVKRKGTLVKL